MTDEHPPVDDLVALALRELDAEQSAGLNQHLIGCGQCRDTYATIDLDVQQVLVAAPSIAPPAGFSGRVLERMGLSDEASAIAPGPGVTPAVAPQVVPIHRGLARRTAALLVAAALLVGALVGVGATLAVRAPDPGAPAQVATVPLRTSDGATVGSVGLVFMDGRQQVVVNVTAGRAGWAYDCVLVDRAGQRHQAATYTLHDVADAWMVPVPASGLARVELISPSGKVWSSATL
ncbi:anti-sigma factor family protein [Propionibacteriaceae bacterium G57]|uniref:anti-sigma factor family protein n=1 Tax=Aestuariimicrobium sp. G57 TaxID=3418485 RepID=UPI003DA76E57